MTANRVKRITVVTWLQSFSPAIHAHDIYGRKAELSILYNGVLVLFLSQKMSRNTVTQQLSL